MTEDIKVLAERAKEEANQLFKEKHYQHAIDTYTRAIQLDSSNAIYYGNRAFANLRLENYGASIEDATRALELDPNYVKAYYRRADAYFSMCKFKESVRDFRLAAKVAPHDPDLRRKLAECEREVKRIRFEEALSIPEDNRLVTDTICLEDMVVEDSYDGPRMERSDDGKGYRITRDFVLAMVEHFKAQKLIHKRFAFQILLEVQRLLRTLPSLVDVEVPLGRHITVCGDVHGQFYDLVSIFDMNGYPSADNPYLFNGDFVDRGSFSVEVIFTLFGFQLLDPATPCMHLNRGNHESQNMTKMYGFQGEVKAKYSDLMNAVFRETFQALPLAYCLASKVIVLHGGLFSEDTVTLDDIRRVDRFREPPDNGIMCEALWSDPQEALGKGLSKRGTGLQFGPDITKAFLKRNNLSLLVRSHEVKEEGYEVTHDGYCITVFSAPRYVGMMANKGAWIRFEGPDMVPKFTQFDSNPNAPNVPPMKYASQFLMGM